MRFGVILAGGRSSRMGGGDKGRAVIGEKTLFSHVADRFAPQVDVLLVSGNDNYGTDLPIVSDITGQFGGPAAGLWGVLLWFDNHQPSADGFFTVPVDGPFLPLDLTLRLGARAGTCVACDSFGEHPTFAYWSLAELRAAFSTLESANNPSLRHLAALCHAERVLWDSEKAFLNINSPDELAAAQNANFQNE